MKPIYQTKRGGKFALGGKLADNPGYERHTGTLFPNWILKRGPPSKINGLTSTLHIHRLRCWTLHKYAIKLRVF